MSRSDIARSKTSRNGTPVAEGLNELAFTLLQRFIKVKANESHVFSPFNLTQALTLLLEASAGTTEQELLRFLNAPHTPLVMRVMDIVSKHLKHAVQLSNHVLTRDDIRLSNSFVQQQPDTVNFTTFRSNMTREDARELVEYVNDLVSDETYGKINHLLSDHDVDPDNTMFILLTTLYFRAEWVHKFPVHANMEDVFHNARGRMREVTYMRQSKQWFDYAENERAQLIELPYHSPVNVRFGIYLPSEWHLPESERLQTLIDQLKRTKIARLDVPKFKLEARYEREIKDVMWQSGVRELFGHADLSHLVRSSPQALQVGKIIHRALIEVDNDGTIAAAATAVLGYATSAPPQPETEPPIEFIANRSFLFYLRETTTDALLFVGVYHGEGSSSS